MPRTECGPDADAPTIEPYPASLAAGDLDSHHEEARANGCQLHAEREHLHTLLELSSAVAPARDLASALSAIAPYLQRVVSHEAASVYLLEDAGRRLGLYA